MDEAALVRLTEESADAGAAIAERAFREELTIEFKTDKTDVVTETDRAAQQAVIDVIEREYPDSTIVGEEKGTAETLPSEGLAWLIDPIDGTANFVRELPSWTTSVACLVDGEPVAAVNVSPALDDRYVATADGMTRNGRSVSVSDRTDPDTFLAIPTLWWTRDRRREYAETNRRLTDQFADIRRIGSAQLELSAVAAGSVEGVVSNVVGNPWDTVAGAAMVEWAGGTVTDIHGDRWEPGARGIVASNGTQHELFCEVARAAEASREPAGME